VIPEYFYYEKPDDVNMYLIYKDNKFILYKDGVAYVIIKENGVLNELAKSISGL
jgi:hypothetical protein